MAQLDNDGRRMDINELLGLRARQAMMTPSKSRSYYSGLERESDGFDPRVIGKGLSAVSEGFDTATERGGDLLTMKSRDYYDKWLKEDDSGSEPMPMLGPYNNDPETGYMDPITGELNPNYRNPNKRMQQSDITGGNKPDKVISDLIGGIKKGQISSADIAQPEQMTDPEIKSLEKQLERWKNKDTSGFKGVDLSPIMALVDSWYGGNQLAAYDKPLTSEDKEEMIAALDHKLASTKYQRAKERAEIKRRDELAKERIEADLQKFKLQEEGRNRRHREGLEKDLMVADKRARGSKDYTKTFHKDMKPVFESMAASFSGLDPSYDKPKLQHRRFRENVNVRLGRSFQKGT
jgi:hypothetical protein